MQIPSSPNPFPPATTKAVNSASSADAGLASAPANSKSATKGRDVAQEFLDYVKTDPIARMRANILKSMRLTEDQLNAMPPEQRKAIEEKIEQLIKEQLEKNANKPGQVVNISA